MMEEKSETYVNPNGVMKNFRLSELGLYNVLEISNLDVTIILDSFRVWAGYMPHESRRPYKDYHHFIYFALRADRDLQLKAAFVIEQAMLRKATS